MKSTLVLCLLITSAMLVAQVKPAFEEVLRGMPNVRDLSISVYGDEAYFSSQSPMGELSAIVQISTLESGWGSPQVASFSGRYHDLEPFLTQDGLTLYFVSNRPMDQMSDEIKDYDIWYVERRTRKSPWSKPINIGLPINTSGNEFYPVLANNGNIYYTADGDGTKGKDDIFMSAYIGGEYTTPISLDTTINTPGYEFNAYVAPDESFLIFTGYNRSDGLGSGDLYISTKNKEGFWSVALNMEEFNSDKMDYCPFVDITKQTLYFTSKRSDIVFEAKKKQSLTELLSTYHRYSNGLSRIYQASLKSYLE